MPALTLAEARTKRCALHPFDGTRTCIGTQCMAWRWDYFSDHHAKNGPLSDGGGGVARGYCGHAGETGMAHLYRLEA
jgi:hypothetical protein